jgi:hypothetical protein
MDKDDPDLAPPQTDWRKVVSKDRFADRLKSWAFGFLSIPDLIEETKDVSEFLMCDWTLGRGGVLEG